ncbi:MAG: GtrA family protein [Dehalococcoidia bacterium]
MSGRIYSSQHEPAPVFLSRWVSPELWRFIKYAAIGIFNGVVDFAVLGTLLLLFDPQKDFWVAATNTAGFLAASVNSFLLHSRFTFRRRVPLISRWFVLFFIVNLGNLVLSNISLLSFRYLLDTYVDIGGREGILLAKLMTAGVLVGYGWVAFRRLFSTSAPEPMDDPIPGPEVPSPVP